jgi:arylsulfatase A-like enzyme
VIPWFSFARKIFGAARNNQIRSMRRKFRGFIMFQFLAMTWAGCRLLFPRHLRHPITTLATSASLLVIPQLVIASLLIAESADRPNILLIMADDLGFSDLGCYGSEIETPHLDSLAAAGLRYSHFYNTGRCWPTRGALLTGYYPQSIRRDVVPGVKSGGGGKRPAWAPLLCAPLREAGYRTYHTGKWHVDGMPVASGFDHSYYLKDQHRFFNPTLHWKDDKKLPPVPKGTDYYATVALGDHVLECLQDHAENHSQEPFFHYLAFAAPHFPLQALPEDIDKYRQRYRAGWDAVRRARWQRIESMGFITADLSAVMRDVGPPYDFPDAMKVLGSGEVNRPLSWDDLTRRQRLFQATKMAIHAAMIDCMDRQIGRVVEQLEAMNALDDTVIFFLSDNGASAEIMVRGDGHNRDAPMGSWASHLCLGPGWSTVSNTPFRYHKTWTHEGGTATPLIVHWPAGIDARGNWRSQVGHVIDLWPTVLQLARVDDFDSGGPQRPEINRHETVRPGVSLVPTFSQDVAADRTLWWSHEGNRALRVGDWKISAAGSDGAWELYRTSQDRTETQDVATTHPEKRDELVSIWESMDQRHVEMATAPE